LLSPTGPDATRAWCVNASTDRPRRDWCYSPVSDTYALGAEAAMALADDDAPAFVARRMNAFASMFLDIDN
jgi:hypothetical protein